MSPEEEANALDTAWFAAHPFATEYRREQVVGELGEGMYREGLRTHVTKLMEGVFYRVGNHVGFDDPTAIVLARLPYFIPWGEVPEDIRAERERYDCPEAHAILALLEAEDKIKAEGEAT
jgi:hypothetical protein